MTFGNSRKIDFRPTISIGNLVALLVLLGSITASHFALTTDVGRLEERIAALNRQVADLSERLEKQISRIENSQQRYVLKDVYQSDNAAMREQLRMLNNRDKK
jgi:uncharacterized protein involved in exopolysaccharide biosynthesis